MFNNPQSVPKLPLEARDDGSSVINDVLTGLYLLLSLEKEQRCFVWYDGHWPYIVHTQTLDGGLRDYHYFVLSEDVAGVIRDLTSPLNGNLAERILNTLGDTAIAERLDEFQNRQVRRILREIGFRGSVTREAVLIGKRVVGWRQPNCQMISVAVPSGLRLQDNLGRFWDIDFAGTIQQIC